MPPNCRSGSPSKTSSLCLAVHRPCRSITYLLTQGQPDDPDFGLVPIPRLLQVEDYLDYVIAAPLLDGLQWEQPQLTADALRLESLTRCFRKRDYLVRATRTRSFTQAGYVSSSNPKLDAQGDQCRVQSSIGAGLVGYVTVERDHPDRVIRSGRSWS
jgi:hypothetical protein